MHDAHAHLECIARFLRGNDPKLDKLDCRSSSFMADCQIRQPSHESQTLGLPSVLSGCQLVFGSG